MVTSIAQAKDFQGYFAMKCFLERMKVIMMILEGLETFVGEAPVFRIIRGLPGVGFSGEVGDQILGENWNKEYKGERPSVVRGDRSGGGFGLPCVSLGEGDVRQRGRPVVGRRAGRVNINKFDPPTTRQPVGCPARRPTPAGSLPYRGRSGREGGLPASFVRFLDITWLAASIARMNGLTLLAGHAWPAIGWGGSGRPADCLSISLR